MTMKQLMVSLTLLVFVMACRKHESAESLRLKTEKLVKGKWMVDSVVRVRYEPIQTYHSSTVYRGAAADSVLFGNDLIAHNYCSEIPIALTASYGMVNYRQIGWGNDFWYITHINANTMVIEKDANYVDQNRRLVQRFYFHR